MQEQEQEQEQGQEQEQEQELEQDQDQEQEQEQEYRRESLTASLEGVLQILDSIIVKSQEGSDQRAWRRQEGEVRREGVGGKENLREGMDREREDVGREIYSSWIGGGPHIHNRGV